MRKLLLLPLVAFLASCNSTKMNSLSTPMYSPRAEINPIRAEVTIDKNKVLEGEASMTYFLVFRIQGDNDYAEGMSYSGGLYGLPNIGLTAKIKSAAAFKALSNSGADIIVHPNYVVTKQNYIFFRKVKVRVKGYAGYFKNFYQKEFCDPCTGDKEVSSRSTSSAIPVINNPVAAPIDNAPKTQPDNSSNKKRRNQ